MAQSKLNQAQAWLRKNNIDLWLTTTSEGRDPASIMLLDRKFYGRHAILIPSVGKPVMISSSMEFDAPKGFRFVEFKKKNEFRQLLRQEISRMGRHPKIAVNFGKQADYLRHGEFLLVRRLLKGKFISSEPLQENLRSVKSREELKLHRRACEASEAAIAAAVEDLRGRTELEVAGLIESEFRRYGCETAFDSIVAFGPNSGKPHHNTDSRKIKKGDMVLIDIGARFKFRCADITRTFAFGTASPKMEKIYKLVKAAQLAAAAVAKAGVAGSHVHAAAAAALEPFGKNFLHSTGHPLGLEVHDIGPGFTAGEKRSLSENQLCTIEPGLYFKDFGVRIEDDVLVTKSGARFLTTSPSELQVIRP